MKATYNKPLMATEEIKKVDVITASGISDQNHGAGEGTGNIAGRTRGRG
ncbi:MAG: hypothetical protein K6F76_04565 [Clostridiales bacterium]|nr:hypothetical protein [Clostridiales bacterium]